MKEKELISASEAAKRLGVCYRSVAKGVSLGMLRAEMCGLTRNRIRGIYADSVDALIRSWNKPGAAKGGAK